MGGYKENNISRHKNLVVILLVDMLITLVGGSTLALLLWINDENDKTNVVFTVNSDTTSNYIKKKIDLKPLISTAGKIYVCNMDE